ncbi:MAG: hypothetical protein V7K14_29460 [Nostoc sp.]|uniref:hypothetical protein n=1 Tax=Nostoc sp. TaxID=1180 RepID=UPI002FF53924
MLLPGGDAARTSRRSRRNALAWLHRQNPPFLRNAKGERGLKTFDFFLVHGGGLPFGNAKGERLYSQASAGTGGFHATSFNGGNPRNGVAPHEQLACDF